MALFSKNGLSHPSAETHDSQDITRMTMRFFGVVLGMASLGLWLVPGAALDGVELLMRLVLSFLFLGIAAGLWSAGKLPDYDEEFQLDLNNHKLNRVLRGRDGVATLAGQYRFEDMDELSLDHGVLRARLAGGQDVLRVAVGARLEPGVAQMLNGWRKRLAV